MNRKAARTPFIALSLALSGAAMAQAAPKPNPLVILWAGSQPDDVAAMSAVRRSLRERGHVDVITYDVENPAVLRASREANHPEWVGDALSAADRAALGKALGAVLVITVSRGEKDDIAIVDMAPTSAGDQATRAKGKVKQDSEVIENLVAHPEQMTRQAAPVVPAPAVNVPPAPANPVASAPANPIAAVPEPTPAPENPVATVPATPIVAAPEPTTPIVTAPVPANPVAAAPANPIVEPMPANPTPIAPAPANPTAAVPAPPAPANPVVPPVTAAHPSPTQKLPAKSPPKHPLVTLKPPSGTADLPKLPTTTGGESRDNPIVVTTKDPISPAAGNGAGATIAQDPEQLRAVAPMIAKGDQALDRDEVAVAISYYRQAVDGAPLFAQPRLKLAKAYLQGGFEDKAVDEAKRALMIAPENVAVQEFLIQLDTNSTTASGTVALYEALIAKNPDNLDAHLGLGDAYWNSGSLDRAEAEYEKAETLAPKGEFRPASQLVRLFVAQSRYGDAIPVLKRVGPGSYRIAARVMHSRLDTLISTLSSGREAFAAGKSSHEQFYDTSKTVSVQANALADFIDKVQAPAEYKVSHLHLSLAASLIAQEAEVLRTFIETSDIDQQDHAVQLEKSAQSEMLTAHAAEEKSGLFAEKS